MEELLIGLSPVLVRSCPHILYGGEATRDPSMSVQLLHNRLAYFQIVRITCGLEMRRKMLFQINVTSQIRQYKSTVFLSSVHTESE